MAFDPQAFLDATQTEVNEKRPPLPTENPASPDGLYTGIIGEIKPRTGEIGKGEKAGQSWLAMNVPITLEVPQQLRDAFGLSPTVMLFDMVFLDMTPQGTIDNSPGKNRRQKDYREATGMNVAGEPFAWRMLQGKVVKVKVTQDMYEGEPQDRIGNIFKA